MLTNTKCSSGRLGNIEIVHLAKRIKDTNSLLSKGPNVIYRLMHLAKFTIIRKPLTSVHLRGRVCNQIVNIRHDMSSKLCIKVLHKWHFRTISTRPAENSMFLQFSSVNPSWPIFYAQYLPIFVIMLSKLVGPNFGINGRRRPIAI